MRENNSILKALGARPISFAKVNTDFLAAGEKLRPFVANTVVYLHKALQQGKEILFEGAQGTFLDIDHGTYPYVTSSNTTAGGACTGSGVPPHRMDRVVGVMKAYTTRVGEGALPTEDAAIADMLHEMGREFGATTGRARRCGWFDAVATRYATMINGIDELAITNLDGLDTCRSDQDLRRLPARRQNPRRPAERRRAVDTMPAGLPRDAGLEAIDREGKKVRRFA